MEPHVFSDSAECARLILMILAGQGARAQNAGDLLRPYFRTQEFVYASSVTSSTAEHRLAAVISGDVAGYSRLIASNEGGAVRLITAYREEIELLVKHYKGRVVDFTGDNFLAEFTSSLAGVRCAVDIQNVLKARNHSLAPEQRVEFRLGVHQGEVRSQDGRLFGTGVNVAARLCALAEPGRICTSAAVYEQLRGNLEIDCEDLGEKSVKNIPNPVHVYRIGLGASDSDSPTPASEPEPNRHARLLAVALVALCALAWFASSRINSRPGDSNEAPILAPIAAMPPPATAPANKPSIAVLPFDNMSDDPDQEYFADGITEDLTTDLSKIRELFVISRNSAFTYKGQVLDVAQVGRELGVRYVLEGSVRKIASRVRINAQLIDVSSNFHVWSDRYDRDLQDVFAVQSEITREILGALHVKIEEAEFERIRRSPPESLTAYESWMKGRALIRRFSRENVTQARVLLERAIELDPTIAEAYAELANSYLVEFAGWNPSPALIDKAVPLVQRALELDPQSVGALVAQAGIAIGRGNSQEAVGISKLARDLSPSNEVAQLLHGIALLQLDRVDEGLVSLEQAVRLNPRIFDFNWTMLGIAHYRAGRVSEATRLWEQVRNASPEATADRILLANLYQSTGRSNEARKLVEEVQAVNPSYTVEMAAEIMVRGGLPDEAIDEAEETLQMAGLPSVLDDLEFDR